MKLMRKVVVSMCLLTLTGGLLTACGGDDDDGDSSAAKLASCKQVCDKSGGAMCPISLPVDTCKQLCDAHAQAPVACQDALKALSDCQLTQTDVCAASGCDAQETAYQQACTK
jgi:hypothetical protein